MPLPGGTSHVFPPQPPSRASEALLWLLALACVVLTLVAHRPDADDAFYVNIAVAAVDVPRQALLSTDTLHGIDGLPLYLPVYRVHSYELLNAAMAYLTGIPAIYTFHWISAAFAALLVPLAYAKLFRLLTPRWWLWSVGVLTVILVAAGETHRWYGNFAFVRIWQGKAVFLSVFLPLIYAYGLRFAVQPTVRGWALLCAALRSRPSAARHPRCGPPRPARSWRWSDPPSVAPELEGRGPRSPWLRLRAGTAWLVRANLRDLLVFWPPPASTPGAQLYGGPRHHAR